MTKLYTELRREMYAQKVTQADLTAALEVSTTYISARFTGHQQWTMEDAFRILDLLQLPHNKILTYFPRGGVAPEPKRTLRRVKLVPVN